MRLRYFILGMILGVLPITVAMQYNSTGGRVWAKTVTQNCSGACTVNLAQGTLYKITLTGNVTSLTFSNGVSGALYRIHFCQDATGTRTITGIDATILGLTAPGVAASKCNPANFAFDGTNYYADALGLLNL